MKIALILACDSYSEDQADNLSHVSSKDIIVYIPEIETSRHEHKKRKALLSDYNKNKILHQWKLKKLGYKSYRIATTKLQLLKHLVGYDVAVVSNKTQEEKIGSFFPVVAAAMLKIELPPPPLPESEEETTPDQKEVEVIGSITNATKTRLLLVAPKFGIREIKLMHALREHYTLVTLSQYLPGEYHYSIPNVADLSILAHSITSAFVQSVADEWGIDVVIPIDIKNYTQPALHTTCPTILDVQDSITMLRHSSTKQAEQAAKLEKDIVTHCNMMISISRPMTTYLCSRYGDKPTIELPCLSAKAFLPTQVYPKLSAKTGERHVVYQGSIVGHKAPHHVKYLFNVFKQLVAAKIHVHLYSNTTNDLSIYYSLDPTYFHRHDPVNPIELSNVLTQYDYSLCVFNDVESYVLQCGVPNKLYDSLVASVPVATTIATPLIADFVSANKCGLVGESLTHLTELLSTVPVLKVSKRIRKKCLFEYNLTPLHLAINSLKGSKV